jgi:AraC family transcriptional regulator
MNYLDQVQRGIDYVEANLDSDIALGDVAKEAGISQWHFQRIFKALTNEALKSYIRSRRLANTLDKLLASDARILDIALAAGYESQESFTRAFKKAFDMTPNEFRKIGDRHLFLKKVEINSEYLRHINRNLSLVPDIYTQATMRLVGLRTLFYSVDSEKNNLGEKLPSLWDAFLARIDEVGSRIPGICYGVVRQTKEKTDLLEYYAAIAVTDDQSPPDGMVSVEIPAARYAKFAHKGPARNMDHTVNYIYSSWLLQSGYRHTYGPDLEFYGAEYHPVSESSVIYYAIPVIEGD